MVALDVLPVICLVVAFGARASFLVPFGYQEHLMVTAPRGYSFLDFTRLGAVVLLACGTTSVAAIP